MPTGSALPDDHAVRGFVLGGGDELFHADAGETGEFGQQLIVVADAVLSCTLSVPDGTPSGLQLAASPQLLVAAPPSQVLGKAASLPITKKLSAVAMAVVETIPVVGDAVVVPPRDV